MKLRGRRGGNEHSKGLLLGKEEWVKQKGERCEEDAGMEIAWVFWQAKSKQKGRETGIGQIGVSHKHKGCITPDAVSSVMHNTVTTHYWMTLCTIFQYNDINKKLCPKIRDGNPME